MSCAVSLPAALERLGFSPVRLGFTLRTAAAAALALIVAWLLGLEHPQWSAMTVWAASLPVRGQLLEKSGFRAAGTVVGALAGIGLLVLSGGAPAIIVPGLALWIGLCAFTGNVVRGFASYGSMLAGYTAAMVTLLHSAHTADPFAIGIDRMLTVLTGVAVALVVGWVFGARSDPDSLAERLAGLSARVLAGLAAHLTATDTGAGAAARREQQALLAEMAVIEEGLDSHAAGSRRSRGAVRTIRRLLSAQVAVVLWMRRGVQPAGGAAVAACLRQAPAALGAGRFAEAEEACVQAARHLAGDDLAGGNLAGGDAVLREALVTLARSQSAVAAGGPPAAASPAAPPVVLHRDWVGARQSLIRSAVVILLVGGLWLATGWPAGAFMLLGTTIMTTVFSTVDNPAVLLRQVIFGQALGAAGAFACRWLVWPMMSSDFGLVLSMLPFIAVGGVLFGHRRASGPIGFDYNMVMLLLLQPALPLTGSPAHSLMTAAAVVLGPAIGLVAFMAIFPVDGRRRLGTLVAMMVRETETMAARTGLVQHRPVWRARLYHRVLRLVRWADKTGADRAAAVEGGFAVLLLGSAILHIDGVLAAGSAAPATVRALHTARARLRQTGRDPQRAARALATAARRAGADPAADAPLLAEAARALAASAGFLATRPAAPAGTEP